MKDRPLYELHDIRHSYNEFTLRIPELIIKKGDAIGLAGQIGRAHV